VEPSKCPACGADLTLSGVRFCSECGKPVLAGEADASQTPQPRISEEQWQYITWGSGAVIVVALAAVAAVIFGVVSDSGGVEASVAVSTTQAPMPSTEAPKAMEIIDVPVTEPIVIESPRLGPSTRYHRDGSVVVGRVTMDRCERSEGMLRASGSIRNDSSLGQAFTYGMTIDLERSRLGTRLARLDAVIDRLGPGEVAEWSVETPSTKVVTIRCDVDTLTVTPLTFP